MPHTGRVFDHFNQGLTVELKKFSPQSMLYVGWRSDCASWWNNQFSQELGIQKIGIIEIYAPNFEGARNRFPSYDVIHGDVREIEKYTTKGQYDMIFWDHGPEHVSKDDLVACTPKLFDHSGKILLYCCPWGNWPQGAEGGNTNEIHYDVDKETLTDLGMTVIPFGSPGQSSGGELIAYKVHQ